jgi:hypothetical protein
MSNLKFLDKEWDFTHVIVTASIDRSANQTWSVMGNFATAAEFLNVDGKIVSGDGKPGTVRQIGEGILELLAGEGLWSYTYTQIAGPMAAFTYHGSVAVTPDGDDHSLITYVLTYDQHSFDLDKQVSEHKRLTKRFQGMVDAMKAKVELA